MKKIKLLKLGPEYIHSSSVSNYVMDDALVDYLKRYETYEQDEPDFMSEQYENFKKDTIAAIRAKVTSMSEVISDYTSMRNSSLYEATLNLIENNAEIIYNGVLHGNDTFKFYGRPDFIIRRDVFNVMFNQEQEAEYVIVDLNFGTLNFGAKSIKNTGRMIAHKAKTTVHRKLLEIVLNKTSNSYLLDKKFTIGLVDDDLTEEIDKGYNWIMDLKQNGHLWDLKMTPLPRPELYPNMCARYDCYESKKEIASLISEITQLWNVGTKQRNLCHSKGIYTITDPRLNTKVMGFSDTKRSETIQKMIELNRDLIVPYVPKKLSKSYDFTVPKKVEFFIDFETFTSVLGNLGREMVFMIGLGIVVHHSSSLCCTTNSVPKWEYYNFRMNSIAGIEEKRIFMEMHLKIDEILKKYGVKYEDANFYHWGHIEKSIYEKIILFYNLRKMNFVDFNNVFKEEPIIIREVYDFGLKSIGKALVKERLIKCDAWDNDMTNGFDAMIEAYKLYSTNSGPESFANIVKYNEIDCRMTYEVVNFARGLA
jgi:hypothetical protein